MFLTYALQKTFFRLSLKKPKWFRFQNMSPNPIHVLYYFDLSNILISLAFSVICTGPRSLIFLTVVIPIKPWRHGTIYRSVVNRHAPLKRKRVKHPSYHHGLTKTSRKQCQRQTNKRQKNVSLNTRN